MAKYEYLFHVEAHEKYETSKKFSEDVWAANQAIIKKDYHAVFRIDSCVKLRDADGRLIRRAIVD